MKKAKGLVFFVIALLILGLAYTAFFGVYTWYGATENTIIRGVKSLLTGIDLGQTAQVIPTPEADDETETTAENLTTDRDIIEGRLSNLGYTSLDLEVDVTNNQIVLTLPLTGDYEVYQIKSDLESVCGKGYLTVRNGDDTDDNGSPTGDIIVSSDDVLGALAGRTTSDQEPAIQVVLDDDGTSALYSATYQMSDDTLSIWMDDTELTAYTIDEAISNGRVVITNDSLTMDDASAMAYKINLGPMSFGFTYDNIVELSSASASNLQNILLVIGCALALICILLILAYRLSGVIISLALILESAFSVIMFTSYFPVFSPKYVTISGVFGMVLLGLITVSLGIWQAERIKHGFSDKTSFDTTIKGGLKGMSAAAADGFIVVGITAFFTIAAFGTSNYHLDWFQSILEWMNVVPGGYSIYPLAFILLYGLLIDMLVVLLVQRAMTNTLSSINAFKKPFLFGGKKDVVL